MHVVKCFTEKYETAKCMLTEMLKEPLHTVLSIDIRTSIATQVYITITTHFVSHLKTLCSKQCVFWKTTQPKTFQKSALHYFFYVFIWNHNGEYLNTKTTIPLSLNNSVENMSMSSGASSNVGICNLDKCFREKEKVYATILDQLCLLAWLI